jgi:hypothetical protein
MVFLFQRVSHHFVLKSFSIHIFVCMIRPCILLFLGLVYGSYIKAQDIDYTQFSDSINQWVETRVKLAKKKMHETVEMPLVVRHKGFGCTCPDHYIGISPIMKEGPFIAPIVPKGFPVSDTVGYSLIVKGYFTGKSIKKDMRRRKNDPAEWIYTLPEFTITSWARNENGYHAIPKISN